MSGKVATGEEGDAQNLVSDQAGDSHHGGTSLVDLSVTLLQLGGIVQFVPAKVQGAVTEITNEFGLAKGITVDHLCHSKKGTHLEEYSVTISALVQGGESLDSVRDALGTGESNAVGGGQVTNDRQHGNTSVLDFDRAESIESILRGILQQAKRVEEAKLEETEENAIVRIDALRLGKYVFRNKDDSRAT
jgi:hypothetical protein